MNNKINTPSGLIIYTKDFQTNTKVIQKPVDNNLYALCWSDDYIVEFNNELILDVKKITKYLYEFTAQIIHIFCYI